MAKKAQPKAKPKDNGKHPGGRPPIYTPEYISELAIEIVVWFKKKRNWWLKDFALEKGFCPQRFSEFAETNKEFSEALKYCNALQESKLVHKSFLPYQDRPAFNALKNVCGWRDKTDITSNDKTIYELTVGNKKTD